MRSMRLSRDVVPTMGAETPSRGVSIHVDGVINVAITVFAHDTRKSDLRHADSPFLGDFLHSE